MPPVDHGDGVGVVVHRAVRQQSPLDRRGAGRRADFACDDARGRYRRAFPTGSSMRRAHSLLPSVPRFRSLPFRHDLGLNGPAYINTERG